jgi:hypothetical protein
MMRDHRLYKAWTITFAIAVTLWSLIDIMEHGKVTGATSLDPSRTLWF